MKKDPWKEDLIQDSVEIDDLYKLAIKSGILAPSTHNSQPWEVKLHKDGVELFDIDKNLKHSDPEHDYKWISIGGFIENFSVCSNYYGYETIVKIKDNSINLSVIKNNKLKDTLLEHVERRYSEKRLFDSKKMNDKVFSSISSIDGLTFITKDKEQIEELASHQYEAARLYKDNKFFARELSYWLKIRSSIKEGMHSKSSGLTQPKLIAGKLALRITPKVLDKMAMKYKNLVACSSAVGFISVNRKSKQELIDAGRVLERVSLIATSNNLSLTPLAAIIENKILIEELKKLQKNTSEKPVIFFRISDIKKPVYHTARKPYRIVVRS